ncbi:MAG: aa3-type cytochrome c oxidase subunit IV [Dongiaceae bacterium]
MASNDDMLREHQRTWHGFTRVMTVVILAVAVILGGMFLFLV